MNAPVSEIVRELRERLRELYGVRLDRVILFGSRARGDADPESDLDVMIVLSDPLDHWQEIRRTGKLVSDLCIKYDVDIARVFATPEEYRSGKGSFYANVRHEGVSA